MNPNPSQRHFRNALDQAGDLSELLRTFDVERGPTHGDTGATHSDTEVYEHDASDVSADDD